jgi:hypothetical protein
MQLNVPMHDAMKGTVYILLKKLVAYSYLTNCWAFSRFVILRRDEGRVQYNRYFNYYKWQQLAGLKYPPVPATHIMLHH